MEIKRLKLSTLIPYPRNSRIHSQDNINHIKRSILEFTQCQVLVIQKSTSYIIVGNGRFEAINQLKKEGKWDSDDTECVILDIDDKKAALLSITDNRSFETSAWDYGNLAQAIKDIDGEFPVSEFGLDDEFISETLSKSFKNEDSSSPDTGTPAGSGEKKSEFVGRFILIYTNEDEKQEWLQKLGVKELPKKPVLCVEDLLS